MLSQFAKPHESARRTQLVSRLRREEPSSRWPLPTHQHVPCQGEAEPENSNTDNDRVANVVVPAGKPCAQPNPAWIAGLRFSSNFATLHRANADWRWPIDDDADKCQRGLRPSCQSRAQFPRGVTCQQPAKGAAPVARRSPSPKPSQTAKPFRTAMNVPFWRAVSRGLPRMLSDRPEACRQAVSSPRTAAQNGSAADDHRSSAD